ncbi:MAG TPA: hypothetical protein DGR79_01975 [Clostridiales bacterium]|nr:hypothetical protein [Clostridiales bacterium]
MVWREEKKAEGDVYVRSRGRRRSLNLVLVEYALWVMTGLWATLFVGHSLVQGLGVLLLVLAILRAFTEKEETPP